jgi:hypothetical protein
MRRGTRDLTARGRQAERSAVRRQGWSEDAAAVKRLAAKARRARKAQSNGTLSRSETQGLVEALGKYISAGRSRAGIKVEQRLYHAFAKKLAAAERKVGPLSDENMDALRSRAESWLASQGTVGAGRFW